MNLLFLENETEENFDFELEEVALTVINKTLEIEQCPYEVEVNLLITDNEGIRIYNRENREIDKPTDVLSFPNLFFEKESDFSFSEKEKVDYEDPETGKIILGDIIISAEKVKEQAKEYGHSEKREYAFLTAHSMLHLCGYDHMESGEAKIMEQKQEEILNLLQITRE